MKFTVQAVVMLTGQLLLRLQHGDWLNAPWGVALAPADFGRFSDNLLIGQFAGGGDTQSSGYIAAYDLTTGKLSGLLQDVSGKPLVIKGIWALSPGNSSREVLIAELAEAAQIRASASCGADIAKAASKYVSAHKNRFNPLKTIALNRAMAAVCTS